MVQLLQLDDLEHVKHLSDIHLRNEEQRAGRESTSQTIIRAIRSNERGRESTSQTIIREIRSNERGRESTSG